jgi:hypothetical protein
MLKVEPTTGEPSYANIQNASPMPKGIEAPALFNDTRLIDINSTPFEELEKLPEWLKKKMYASDEYAGRVNLSDKLGEATQAGVIEPPQAGKPIRPKVAGGPSSPNNGEPNPDDIPF